MNEEIKNNDDIIENVKYIFKKRIYNIPEYQRGYKWSEKDVNALLNDIDNFKVDEKDNSKFYCLQNITIKKQNDNIYEVIDGQQRLTTLSILLSYLGKIGLLKENDKYKIKYSIRDESEKFLYELLKESNPDKDYLNNDLSYKDNFYKDYDSQDLFHFCLAKHTIKNFFGNDENKKEGFTTKLLNNVKLIVNDVSSGNDVKGETIFKNLNSNKVALEYYDLIRAIFITRVKKEGNDIDLAEKRIKIGIDIDNMNIWWSDENVKEYFKMFSNENNISMLYDLYWKCINNESNNNNEKSNAYKAQSNNEALFKYLDSNTDKAERVFKEVLRFHNTMADWYEDKEIYHLLGFIGKQNIEDIKIIWDIWERADTTREDFKNKLKQIIKNNLIKEEDNKSDNVEELYKNYLESIKDINNYWYYRKNDTIKLLILIDIIKILQNTNHKLPANYFSANDEDIEHIFSKTPNNETTIEDAIKNINLIISLADDNKKEELINYKKTLEIHQKEIILDNIGKLKEYREKIRDIPYIHSIGNLVLLNSKTNRGYGNASYVDKRRIIIELYEKGDKYIRNHTSSIFSKNVNEWTIDNIKNTAEDIRKEIEKFFDDNNK